ncbi:MAG TPA: hypothetical protein VF665_16485 [Longimicrobium sp.]|jgi:hypothetical protein|uniref:hypothetical protein n=1 Tax=Longimicrobium sp. TaxID=2029185 RepID=UPI002EDA6F0D
MHKLLSACVLMLGLLPAKGFGQNCSLTAPDADENLRDLAPMFYDPDETENRGPHVRLLTAADTQYVVRDDSVCQAVLDVVIPRMRRAFRSWAAGREGAYEATVYRFGPYLAVEITDGSMPGSHVSVTHNQDGSTTITGLGSSRSPLFVLDAGSMAVIRFLY